MRTNLVKRSCLRRTLAILISSIVLLTFLVTAQAAISTVASLQNPGWSDNRKRVVFYNGSRYFLLYNRGTADIYYQSSTDNVTWSGESTLIGGASRYFDIYLISDTKFDLVYYGSPTTTYVRTCTIYDATITPGSASVVEGVAHDSLAVARSGAGDRIYVVGMFNNDFLRVYSADQTGDAEGVTSWTKEVNDNSVDPDKVAIVPYEGTDEALVVYTLDAGGSNNDGVYSRVITHLGGAGSEIECGNFDSLPDFSSPIRISDTDFRIITRPSGAAMEEWKWDDASWTQVDANIDPENETDQESPSLFYDRLSGDMYVFSVDTGETPDQVERHKKPSGGSWETEVVSDSDPESDDVSYPITQMHEPPYGSSRTVPRDIVWAYRVVTGTEYDLKVGTLTPTPLYRSVGRGASGNGEDLNTDSRTVKISGTTATFSGPMPDKVGVGDVLAYDSGGARLAFIHGRTSSTVYSVRDKNGDTPTAAPAGTAVGVYRAYISLNNWNYQFENTNINEPVEDDVNPSKNLVSANTVMMVACYDDGWGADYGADISGWTTDACRYIRIYTPVSISEVGASQRHNGKWDDSKYRIQDDSAGINITGGTTKNIWIDGLQIYLNDVTGNGNSGILINQTGSVNHRISNNIVRGVTNNTWTYVGIYSYAATTPSVARIWNNIVYGFNGTNAFGIYNLDADFTVYSYNNTVYDCMDGVSNAAGTFSAKNNISMCDVVDSSFTDFSGTFDSDSTHNYSSDTTAPDNGGANPSYENKTLADVDFVSTTPGSEDFHLQDTSDAIDVGTDLSSDSNLAFSDDIDADYRYGSWDIGADEYAGCAFEYRRQITLNYSERGSTCGASYDLSHFPVLISLSGNWLKTKANGGDIYSADGYDIIFRDTNNSQLDHEIEKYDGSATGGTLVAWVRIPDLFAGNQDTVIYMYYGNQCISDITENPTGVWDTAYGWSAVWHLKEDPSGTAPQMKDSTSNANHGTSNGAMTSVDQVPGKIDGSLDFDGSDDEVLRSNAIIGDSAAWTITAWIQMGADTADQRTIYSEGHTTAGGYLFLYVDDSGSDVRFYSENPSGDWAKIDGGSTNAEDNQPHYVAMVQRSKTDRELFVDTVSQGTDTRNAGTLTHNTASIGYLRTNWVADPFKGIIDEVRISCVARDDCWIGTEFNNMDDPGNFITLGPEDPFPPTAVTLLSFTARGEGEKVRVEWETAQEINNLGFHLFRAESRGGSFVRLTEKLIPGLISSVRGKAYVYEDTEVTPGTLYYYRLEAIDSFGKKTVHGPICVDWDGDGMSDDWELSHGLDPMMNDGHFDYDQDGLSNLEEYERGTDPFNPDSDGDGILDGEEDGKREGEDGPGGRSLTRGVEILSSDEKGVTLELRTDGFDTEWVEAEGEDFSRLRVPEYIHGFTEVVGKPELPIKGVLLDLPEGGSATLDVLEAEAETYPGYWIYPVPEKTVDGEAGMAHVREVFTIDDLAYATDSFYPSEVARLGETYTFRDQRKQKVLFYPFSFNPARRELVQYRRIRVRINYEETQETLFMKAMVQASGPGVLAWSPPSEDSAYKILVSEEGIYWLTRAYLESQGVDVDGMALSRVRLYNLGEEIAIDVYDEDGDDRLDPEDHVTFYGRPPESEYAKYTGENIYWFILSGGTGEPRRMAEIEGMPEEVDPIADTHSATVHHEEDEEYWIGAPGGDTLDRWFFSSRLFGQDYGGGAADFPLTVSDVAGPGSLVISLSGASDVDHQVDVWVNGDPVGSYTWSGISPYEATISPASLFEGENTVTMECMSGLDVIYVDAFWVTYPRGFGAVDDELSFSHEAGYRYQVSGFGGSDLLAYDITDPGDVGRIVGFPEPTEGPPYTLDFEPQSGEGERRYLVLSTQAIKAPLGIIEDTPSTLSDPENGADYILITHRDLGWDGSGQLHSWLSDLLALRESQGLRVKVVDVEDIFDEFSYGIETPQAIKDFLSYAYTNWREPAPRYVVLLGAGTYDYKNNWDLDESGFSYVPSYTVFTQYMGETLSDEWFVTISGHDAIPDLYIGRLPAASPDQAAVMVGKILSYETTPNTKTWEKNVLLVSDNQIEAYEAVFETMNEDAASLIPQRLNAPFKGYLNDYVVPGVLTKDIKDRINDDEAGALMVNYSGHGSTQIWADEAIFDTDDVVDLVNGTRLPLFVSMSCLTGYFAYPESVGFPSLGEALLRSEEGAVAALMPTGMTTPSGQQILDRALFEAIFSEDIRTLGEAIALAKQILLANGSGYEETSETFLLFGDPATALKVHLPRRPTGVSAQSSSGGMTISWNNATDCNGAPVSGYNLYRSEGPGETYSKLNASLIAGTQYNDTAAAPGTTYSYVVTSVDAEGDESVQSMAMSATAGTVSATSSGSSGCFIAVAASR